MQSREWAKCIERRWLKFEKVGEKEYEIQLKKSKNDNRKRDKKDKGRGRERAQALGVYITSLKIDVGKNQ